MSKIAYTDEFLEGFEAAQQKSDEDDARRRRADFLVRHPNVAAAEAEVLRCRAVAALLQEQLADAKDAAGVAQVELERAVKKAKLLDERAAIDGQIVNLG